jgi:hypothetical protein
MKVKHLIFLGLAAVGVLYVAHMMASHQGQSILGGLGIGGK